MRTVTTSSKLSGSTSMVYTEGLLHTHRPRLGTAARMGDTLISTPCLGSPLIVRGRVAQVAQQGQGADSRLNRTG